MARKKAEAQPQAVEFPEVAAPQILPEWVELGEAQRSMNQADKVIHPMSVDFSSEGLNNMAKKINEIIEHLNGRH